jgi:DNA (cytosine-5)-methyltransferase 1
VKYLSLFSGIGGFELGIEKAFRRKKQKAVCVGYSEIDRHAIKIYETHFPKHKNFNDIRTIDPDEIKNFDILVAGFPCQAFSIAGKRLGFDDPEKGTQFFEIARILRDKRPKYFLLENVRGILSHDHGRSFKVIITALDALGYNVQWMVLDSQNFGVPQHRERVYIIGHLRKKGRQQIFSVTGNNGENIILPTITTRVTADTNGTYVGKKQKQKTTESGGPDNGHGQSKPDNSNIIGRKTYSADSRIRRLTPIECERLQGFPDNWTQGISDSQRYKCLGNAVTVNVIEKLIGAIFKK